jgi:hypothetical protein
MLQVLEAQVPIESGATEGIPEEKGEVMSMTPFKIDIIMHYHVSPTDYWETHKELYGVDTGVNRAVTELCAEDLLYCQTDGRLPRYKITERGTAYCEALCKMPLPVKKWVMDLARLQAIADQGK